MNAKNIFLILNSAVAGPCSYLRLRRWFPGGFPMPIRRLGENRFDSRFGQSNRGPVADTVGLERSDRIGSSPRSRSESEIAQTAIGETF